MKKIAILGLLALSIGAAQAEGYIGLGLGGTAISGCTAGYSCQSTAKGIKAYAGVMLNDSIAIELGQIGFGKGEERDSTGAPTLRYKVNATVLNLAWRPEIQEDLRGVLRVGGASSSLNLMDANGPSSESKTTGNFYWGFGAEYALAKRISCALAADFAYAGGTQGNHSVRMVSLALQGGF